MPYFLLQAYTFCDMSTICEVFLSMDFNGLSASVVNEEVGGSVLGVSECGGGLNDVKVLKGEDGGLEWWK